MSDPISFWLVAILGSIFVGASKGGLPAIALLSVPLLSLVMSPMQGAALLLPVYLISDSYGLYIYRKSFSLRNIAILLPAGIFGITIGWLLAGRTDDDTVRLVVGIVGLGFVAMRVRSRFQGNLVARKADIPRGIFWGTISGFTTFVAHAGGPAFQIFVLPQKLAKMTFAGTSTILFALLNLAKLPPYLALDLIGFEQMRTAVFLAPFAIFGAWMGYRLTRVIPERLFFIIVEIALFTISLLLIRAALI